MFCKNCGAEISENAVICLKCGASTTEKPATAASQPPKSYLAWSILTTIFCCLPFGIVGIVNASRVESRFYAGDMEGAQRASDNARRWTWIAFAVGLGWMFIYMLIYIVWGVALFGSALGW
ncbi:MAG: CD225/dispanin family protein [Prevotellaceae bacterium]|jgi:hypothetical protein|nr:CD225/dispanin family protein [Prevotellaceae bacterium]